MRRTGRSYRDRLPARTVGCDLGEPVRELRIGTKPLDQTGDIVAATALALFAGDVAVLGLRG
jgi:hypothetical protein